MKFWDTSAVVPLLVPSARTDAAIARVREDAAMVVWWGTWTECVSACARLEREGRLTADGMALALGRLHALADHWIEVPAGAAVREQATRALRLHPLRAADALQLGAAIVAADHSPATMEFVTNDERLSLAAAREGFVTKPG